jgi:hypothetical protein
VQSGCIELAEVFDEGELELAAGVLNAVGDESVLGATKLSACALTYTSLTEPTDASRR